VNDNEQVKSSVRIFMQEAMADRVQREFPTNGFGSEGPAKETCLFINLTKDKKTLWKWNRFPVTSERYKNYR
jgi:hypothetical protein